MARYHSPPALLLQNFMDSTDFGNRQSGRKLLTKRNFATNNWKSGTGEKRFPVALPVFPSLLILKGCSGLLSPVELHLTIFSSVVLEVRPEIQYSTPNSMGEVIRRNMNPNLVVGYDNPMRVAQHF